MPITLRSDSLEVIVAPERGADIVQVTDRATGISTLSVSPTSDTTTPAAFGSSTMVQWTTGYPGGWQLLVPNAGPERHHDGVLQGYHGESALSAWETLEASESEARFTARLITAPLELHRHVQLDGDELVVTDSIHNRSEDPVSTRVLQHPAFGQPFLDEHSYLITDARQLITDAQAAGTLAGLDIAGPPASVLPAGPIASSVALPAPGSRSSLFGALTDFPNDEVAVTFASPTHGFGMRLSWQRDHYPMAWLWIEANEGSSWPWFRRMFAIAIEPGNILPGEGTASTGHPRGGLGTTLPGQGTLTTTVRLRRVSLDAT